MTTRKPKPETSLATTESITSNYLALQGDSGKVAEIIRENLQGQTLTPFDLDRVKVPTGGGTSFEVPTFEGSEPSKTITGIILHFTNPRGWWEHGLDDENAEVGPPDCFSNDGKIGHGKYEGRECASCPLAQFGSGKNGGQACKMKQMLFMLQPDSYLPLVIQVPTMSIRYNRGGVKSGTGMYFQRFAARGVPFWSVVTELSLEQTKQNRGPNTYSRIVPKVAGELSAEEVEQVKQMRDSLLPFLQSSRAVVAPDAEDRYLNDDDEDAHEPYYQENAEQQEDMPF